MDLNIYKVNEFIYLEFSHDYLNKLTYSYILPGSHYYFDEGILDAVDYKLIPFSELYVYTCIHENQFSYKRPTLNALSNIIYLEGLFICDSKRIDSIKLVEKIDLKFTLLDLIWRRLNKKEKKDNLGIKDLVFRNYLINKGIIINEPKINLI